MNTSKINFPAVRAFNRVFSPHAEAASFAAEMDSMFDAGEFSCGFNHGEKAYERTLTLVASRFGITPVDLDYMVWVADMEQTLRNFHTPLPLS